MITLLKNYLDKMRLNRIEHAVEKYIKPAVAIDLIEPSKNLDIGCSKAGGCADLPESFIFLSTKGRNLDFICQINLEDACLLDQENLLPKTGLLSFFYDLTDLPWGYDPKNLNGFKVSYFSNRANLKRRQTENFLIPECQMYFRQVSTFPWLGSDAYEQFSNDAKLTSDEHTRLWIDFPNIDMEGSISKNKPASRHRLLGHCITIQGDMQLEAELVSNGLFCGDERAYNSDLRFKLEKNLSDWICLLQIDVEDESIQDCGASGMMYYWIKNKDLQNLDFDKVWMTMQCT